MWSKCPNHSKENNALVVCETAIKFTTIPPPTENFSFKDFYRCQIHFFNGKIITVISINTALRLVKSVNSKRPMMGFICLHIIYAYTLLACEVLWWRRRRAGNRESSSSRIQTQGSKEKLRLAVTRDAIQLQQWARTERSTTAAHIL